MRNTAKNLILPVLFFFGCVSTAYADVWTPKFEVFPMTFGLTYSIATTTSYYEINLNNVASANGVYIGFPTYTQRDWFNNVTRSIIVDYEITQNTTASTCGIGLYNHSGTLWTGATAWTITGTETRNQRTLTYTSSGLEPGGVMFRRLSGTCNATMRIYSVKDADGEVLWSPPQPVTVGDGDSNSGGSGTTTVIFPDEMMVTTQNDDFWTFLILWIIWLSMLFGLIHLIKPFYGRK